MPIEQISPELERIVSVDQEIVELGSGYGGDAGPAEGPLWWKEGGYLMVSVSEGDGGENVEIRLPARVVDALLSGEGDELDLVGAMEALVDEGEGELVKVTGDNENVRVWVDRVAEAN